MLLSEFFTWLVKRFAYAKEGSTFQKNMLILKKKKKSSELPVEDSEEVYDGAKYSLHPEKHKEQF